MPRPGKLAGLAQAFERGRAVVLHGASGQGKSTLAYRFLKERFPLTNCFRVTSIADREHALSVARALQGHAEAMDVPLILLVDVSPRDVDWPELARQLVSNPRIRVLISIREEDWRRAGITDAELPVEAIELSMDETEARDIYQYLVKVRRLTPFLRFEEAWDRFGRSGPLLEFVYLITQQGLLAERLTEQVHRLQDEVRSGARPAAELELLALVSVAGAYEARLEVRGLLVHLNLPVPNRAFHLLEREFLIRMSDNGSLVSGLHPIRSRILADLLCDAALAPWAEHASAVLSLLHEPDIEGFLLYVFSRHRTDVDPIFDALRNLQPRTWVGVVGAARALLWLGIAEYADANAALARQAFDSFGAGWSYVLDFDIGDAMPGTAQNLWRDLGQSLPAGRLDQIEALRAQQTDKRQAFARIAAWLRSRTTAPNAPSTVEDWASLAEAVFWAGRTDVGWPLADWLPLDSFTETLLSLPSEVQADVHLGLSEGHQGFPAWLERQRAILLEHFRRDATVVVLEDNGERVLAEFLIPLLAPNEGGSSTTPDRTRGNENRLHAETMWRIWLLRRLFPDRQRYACQGRGMSWLHLPQDETRKDIDKRMLAIPWLTSVNRVFSSYLERKFRPADWPAYAHALIEQREVSIRAVAHLEDWLQKYFLGRAASQGPDFSLLENAYEHLRAPASLPESALDEWGFAGDADSPSGPSGSGVADIQRNRYALVLQPYRLLVDARRKYTSSLANFVQQCVMPLMTLPAIAGAANSIDREELRTRAERVGLDPHRTYLSRVNLAEALKELPYLQRACRAVLGPIVDPNVLSALDTFENRLLGRVWPMWWTFTTTPQRRFVDARTLCAGEMGTTVRKIRGRFQRGLDGLRKGGIHVRLASETLEWEGRRALWVVLDGNDAQAVHSSFRSVVDAFRRAVAQAKGGELQRFALELAWSSLVVVPLLRGRTIAGEAWQLPTLLLSNGQDEVLGWWNDVPKPISVASLSELKIERWSAPILTPAETWHKATAKLLLISQYCISLGELRDLDDLGVELLGAHIGVLLEQFLISLGEAVSAAEQLAMLVGSAATEEDANRYLPVVAGSLAGFANLGLAELDPQAQAISLCDVVEWSDALQRGVACATVGYLSWASFVAQRGVSGTA